MPHILDWYDDQCTIVRLDLHGDVTTDEFALIIDELNAKFSRQAKRRYLVIEIEASTVLPVGRMELDVITRLLRSVALDHVAVYGVNKLHRLILRMAFALSTASFTFTEPGTPLSAFMRKPKVQA